MLKTTRNVFTRDLLPAPQLAERQARIARGLLKDGLCEQQIRELQWYDPALDVHASAFVNTAAVHEAAVNRDMDLTPDPEDARHGGLVAERGVAPDAAVEKRKAYRKDWMAKKRAEAKT